ncbi:MAG: Rab family GTPase [Promethearchaeota archaeon]
MSSSTKRFVLKILTAGDGGVGKTTLLHRYVNDRFISDTSMTIGVQFHLKKLTLGGVEVTCQLWDFGGQERFRFLLPTYANGAKGALLLFDLTRMNTTLSLKDSWLPIIRKEDPNLPVVLVGTKKDMVSPDFRVVDPNFPLDFIKENHLQGYVETSSKTGEKVDEAFRILVKAIFDYNKIPYDESSV